MPQKKPKSKSRKRAAKPASKPQPAPRAKAPTYPDEMVIAALKAAGGKLSFAAEKLGCDRATIHRRLRVSKAVRRALRDIVERRLDAAEIALDSLVLGQDFKAIKFLLETQGRKRGYVKRVEQAHSGGVKLSGTVAVVEDPNFYGNRNRVEELEDIPRGGDAPAAPASGDDPPK